MPEHTARTILVIGATGTMVETLHQAWRIN